MNILIHTQYYPPEIGAPQARLSALARGLARRGHTVTVLTAMPNYPQGKIYAGYGGWSKTENAGDVKIIRAWILPSKSKSVPARLLNYFSFAFSSFWVGLFRLRAPDIILTESPPLFLGIAGYLLARLKRARWIFNVSDLWPESAVRLGMAREGIALRISRWLESFFYRHAWRVSGQSRGILEDITARFPSVQTHHLSNGTDTSKFCPDAPPARIPDDDPPRVLGLYAGLHGLAQGLDVVLAALRTMDSADGPRVLFVGDGPVKQDLIEQARRAGLQSAQFLEPLPHSEIPALLARADFCIVPLGLSLPGAVPSKLYEAMSAARPVLLMAEGEAAQIVRAHDCGLVVAPGDADALAESMRRLARDAGLRRRLGQNGRAAALEYFDHGRIVENFEKYLVRSFE